nr:unnamed protein product [Callosobruchus analis]
MTSYPCFPVLCFFVTSDIIVLYTTLISMKICISMLMYFEKRIMTLLHFADQKLLRVKAQQKEKEMPRQQKVPLQRRVLPQRKERPQRKVPRLQKEPHPQTVQPQLRVLRLQKEPHRLKDRHQQKDNQVLKDKPLWRNHLRQADSKSLSSWFLKKITTLSPSQKQF